VRPVCNRSKRFLFHGGGDKRGIFCAASAAADGNEDKDGFSQDWIVWFSLFLVFYGFGFYDTSN